MSVHRIHVSSDDKKRDSNAHGNAESVRTPWRPLHPANISWWPLRKLSLRQILSMGIFLCIANLFFFVNYKAYHLDQPLTSGCQGIEKKRFDLPHSAWNHPYTECQRILSKDQATIPKIVHYVITNVEPKTLTFLEYVAIVSMHKFVQPQEMMLHFYVLPEGYWWEQVKSFFTVQHPIRDVQSIFGNPVTFPAHKSDVIRLEVLMQYGGIYADLDYLLLQPIDALLPFPMVLGQQASLPGHWNKLGNYLLEGKQFHISGLGNAFILARKDASFLHRWYDQYRNFDGSSWGEHSTRLPGRMATWYPNELITLAPSALFTPTAERFQELLVTTPRKKNNEWLDLSPNYGIHAWSSLWGRVIPLEYRLDRIQSLDDLDQLKQVDSLFGEVIRYILDVHQGQGEGEGPLPFSAKLVVP